MSVVISVLAAELHGALADAGFKSVRMKVDDCNHSHGGQPTLEIYCSSAIAELYLTCYFDSSKPIDKYGRFFDLADPKCSDKILLYLINDAVEVVGKKYLNTLTLDPKTIRALLGLSPNKELEDRARMLLDLQDKLTLSVGNIQYSDKVATKKEEQLEAFANECLRITGDEQVDKLLKKLKGGA